MGPRLADLAEARRDIAIRTLNINRPGAVSLDFDSPLAIQYGISSLPAFLIIGPDGRPIDSGPMAFMHVVQCVKRDAHAGDGIRIQ